MITISPRRLSVNKDTLTSGSMLYVDSIACTVSYSRLEVIARPNWPLVLFLLVLILTQQLLKMVHYSKLIISSYHIVTIII